VLVLKELEVLKRVRALAGYTVGSADLGRLSKPRRGALDMAEVAGSNPAELIVLFTIGHTEARIARDRKHQEASGS